VINGGHWRPAESHDSHSARIDDKARHSQVTLCFQEVDATCGHWVSGCRGSTRVNDA